MIKQLNTQVDEEHFPLANTQSTEIFAKTCIGSLNRRLPQSGRLSPPKRKQLALWSSLIAAKALTSYYEANHKTVNPSSIEMIAFEDLAYLDSSKIDDYELLFMAVYERDSFSDRALENFNILSSQKNRRSHRPVTICHCGRAETKCAQRWRRVIKTLSANRQIKVNYFQNEIYRGEFSL